jgi:hypothetical protein
MCLLINVKENSLRNFRLQEADKDVTLTREKIKIRISYFRLESPIHSTSDSVKEVEKNLQRRDCDLCVSIGKS